MKAVKLNQKRLNQTRIRLLTGHRDAWRPCSGILRGRISLQQQLLAECEDSQLSIIEAAFEVLDCNASPYSGGPFSATAFPFFPLVVFNTYLDFSRIWEQQRMEQQLCFNLILKLLSKKAFPTFKKKRGPSSFFLLLKNTLNVKNFILTFKTMVTFQVPCIKSRSLVRWG